jgi:lysophospholipase L1-like esterase
VKSARALLLNLALACMSVGFVLGAFEIGLRVAGYRALYEMYSKPSLFWQYDALLGWSHEPHARGRFVGPRPWPVEFDVPIEINSLGLRGPELPPRRDGELRVLFLGDSMVAGFEVAQPDTFVARLADELSGRLGRRVVTINAGVRGYGSDQYLLYYQERGRLLEPDVVVIFHSANDPLDNSTLHETRRPFGKPALVPGAGGRLAPVGLPVPRYPECEEVSLSSDFVVVKREDMAFRLVCELQMALLDHSALFSYLTITIPWSAELLRELYYFGNPHWRLEFHTEWRTAHATRILLELVERVREDGARVLVTGGPEELKELDRAALEAASAPVRDLGEVWYEPREEVRWNHDSHFNAEGHRRVMAILAPDLEAALRGAASASAAERRAQ